MKKKSKMASRLIEFGKKSVAKKHSWIMWAMIGLPFDKKEQIPFDLFDTRQKAIDSKDFLSNFWVNPVIKKVKVEVI